MNLKIKIITRSISSAIVASAFFVVTGLATAEDTKSKSKSPRPGDSDAPKKLIARAQEERATQEKEAQKHKKELSDLYNKEWAAQHEKFRREHEQREAIEKADMEKAKKDRDKSSE